MSSRSPRTSTLLQGETQACFPPRCRVRQHQIWGWDQLKAVWGVDVLQRLRTALAATMRPTAAEKGGFAALSLQGQ